MKHLDRIIFKAELPFFPDAISSENPPKTDKVEKPKPKTAAPTEPKTNLGKMLADLKIEK